MEKALEGIDEKLKGDHIGMFLFFKKIFYRMIITIFDGDLL